VCDCSCAAVAAPPPCCNIASRDKPPRMPKRFEPDGRWRPEHYFVSHHHRAALAAVMAMDTDSESEISLIHSQYDTDASPHRPNSRIASCENQAAAGIAKDAWGHSFGRYRFPFCARRGEQV
jgi:hypothetical protein